MQALNLPILQPGDAVEIIAPASRCADDDLQALQDLLVSWQLRCVVAPDVFGEDLLCAHTDTARFHALQQALQRADTKLVVCARGGYGSMRLIPELRRMRPPAFSKWFLGMSDITALHLYFQQAWHWPTLHASLIQAIVSKESIASVHSVLFGHVDTLQYTGKPLNALACQAKNLEGHVITGGNVTLIQASIGTAWQMDSVQKIVFLEEVNERAFRVDRMLEHLRQANILKGAVAIILGDFLNTKELDPLVFPVLERFAHTCDIPVFRLEGIGHGQTNWPLPLGVKTTLRLGETVCLDISIHRILNALGEKSDLSAG